MSLFQVLQALAAQAQAARIFPAPYKVCLLLNPSVPGEDAMIEEVSGWASSNHRAGRSRRTVKAGCGEVVFEFENAVDAVEFKLRFG